MSFHASIFLFHCKIVKKLLKCLEEERKKASPEIKIDIGIAISHFQDEEIQTFLNKCFENVTAKDIQARAFGHVFGGLGNGFVTDMIRLSIEDDGVNPTDDDVIKQNVNAFLTQAQNRYGPPANVSRFKKQF